MTSISRITPAVGAGAKSAWLLCCAVVATACAEGIEAPPDETEQGAAHLTGTAFFGGGTQVQSGDDDDGQPGSEIHPAPGFFTQAAGEAAGMTTSRHNLYWTNNVVTAGVTTATVFVMDKNSIVANPKRTETRAGLSFGAIAYRATDDYYIYYVVNEESGPPISRIMRVPLYARRLPILVAASRLSKGAVEILGGPVVIAESPAFIGQRDLVVDDQRLYWASEAGIHSVALAGGPVTTLAAAVGAAKLGLDGAYVYYSEGAAIRRVPSDGGGDAAAFVAADSAVTALSVNEGWVTWGEASGAVRARLPSSRLPTRTLRGPLDRRSVRSVMRSGGRTLWSDCNRGLDSACSVSMHLPTGETELLVADDHERLGHITANVNGGGVFWSDSVAIRRYNYSH
jgi:hypothetical protein